jgi:hypothetical protein
LVRGRLCLVEEASPDASTKAVRSDVYGANLSSFRIQFREPDDFRLDNRHEERVLRDGFEVAFGPFSTYPRLDFGWLIIVGADFSDRGNMHLKDCFHVRRNCSSYYHRSALQVAMWLPRKGTRLHRSANATKGCW